VQVHQIWKWAAFDACEDDIARVGVAGALIAQRLKDGYIARNTLAGWIAKARKGQLGKDCITLGPIPPVLEKAVNHQVLFDLHVALHRKRLAIAVKRILSTVADQANHTVLKAFAIDKLGNLLHAEHIWMQLVEQVQQSFVLRGTFFGCAAEVLDAPTQIEGHDTQGQHFCKCSFRRNYTNAIDTAE
jgi:hypothetical protein